MNKFEVIDNHIGVVQDSHVENVAFFGVECKPEKGSQSRGNFFDKMLRFNRRIFIRQFSSSPPTSSFSSPPHPLKSSPTSTTVSPEEIKKFVDAAQEWWDPNGKSFGMLHRMNPVRVGYIRDFVDKIPLPGSNGLEKDLLENTTDSSNKSNSIRPFSNLKMLDIGCGGGLLSEVFELFILHFAILYSLYLLICIQSLARLGGDVIGADAGLENIQIAKLHMLDDPGLSPSTTTTATTPAAARLQYMHTTAERLAESQPQSFDVVCALEIIEHVADRKLFLQACSQLVKVRKLCMHHKRMTPFRHSMCFSNYFTAWRSFILFNNQSHTHLKTLHHYPCGTSPQLGPKGHP